MKAYARVSGLSRLRLKTLVWTLLWAPRLCQLLDVMEVKKPAISRCFAATQLCTPFVVDQHLSRILAAIFPRMNCEVPADDYTIPDQSVSS